MSVDKFIYWVKGKCLDILEPGWWIYIEQSGTIGYLYQATNFKFILCTKWAQIYIFLIQTPKN